MARIYQLAICLFLLPSVSLAQLSEGYVLKVFERTMRDENVLRRQLELQGVPQRLQPLFIAHGKSLFGNEKVVQRLASEFHAIHGAMTKENTRPEAFRDFGTALTQDWALKGIKRLQFAEMRSFYVYASRLFRLLDTKTCGAMARNELNATQLARAELSTLNQRSKDEVVTYLSTLRRSIVSHIEDHPTYVALTPSERAVAEKVYTNAMLKMIDTHPQRERLYRAAENLATAPDDLACEFMLIGTEAALKAEGTVGMWVLRYISE